MVLNNKYILQIINIIKEHPKSWYVPLNSNKNKHLLEYILLLTEKFANYSMAARIYLVVNNLDSPPLCLVCKEKYISNKAKCNPLSGFKTKYCGSKCAAIDNYNFKNISEQKRKEINLKISKAKNNFSELKKQLIQEKRKNICLKKYGVDVASKNKEVIQKVVNSLKSKSKEELADIRKRTKETCLKKYGVETYSNSEKALKTRFEKNNGKFESLQSTEKRKLTNLKKYGCENVFSNDEVKRKIKEIILEKYNVASAGLLPHVILKSKITKWKNSYLRYILTSLYDEPLFTENEFIDSLKNNTPLKFKCKKCGNVFESYYSNAWHRHCQNCWRKISSYSKEEKDLKDFVKSICSNEIIENGRLLLYPLELDIYIPEKKIAIEYDGLYWHSEANGKDKNYHLNKTELCEKQGILLIHIFENEWLFKLDICKSRISNLLGIYDKKLYARKGFIKILSSNEANAFVQQNHILGYVDCKINIGLFFDDELVSVMTFSKPRFSKKYDYELVRFCSKLNYHVVGAAGKLLKYFEETYKPTSIVSYADRRWSTGNLYKKLGFTEVGTSLPAYWYWKDDLNLLSRIKFQKHKLKNILENFDENLSESQNMANNGYNRIFDCGNIVFVKN